MNDIETPEGIALLRSIDRRMAAMEQALAHPLRLVAQSAPIAPAGILPGKVTYQPGHAGDMRREPKEGV